ncbi:MAG: class I SAM-dependent methyltransferase [Bacteroidota bacterium]
MSDETRERGSLSTAHSTWDQRWTNAAGRADWLAPAPEVVQAVDLLKTRGARRALDLGCGVGRHARLLADAGLEVHAADASVSGLAYARAQDPGGAIRFVRSDFTALPFAPAVFDFALSWNVIYHGDRTIVARALAELARVLRPGGLLQITMLSKRNALFGQGAAVAADTYVADTDDEEKRHPHYYCDAVGLVALLEAFEPLYLLDREQTKPGSYHWAVLAERRS